jgi:hypothetical protein
LILILACTMAIASPIFGGDDHDKIAHQVVELTSYLRTQSVEDLRSYCIKIQSYTRKLEGKEERIGGVHDYVFRMDQDACIKYILTNSLKYRELLELGFFKTTVEAPKVFLGVEEKHEEELGLTDYVFRLDRATLVAFALGSEAYVNDKTGKGMIIGGLHDKIRNMSDSDIAHYLIDVVKQNRELDDYPKLTEVATKYGFITPPVMAEPLGGLHDYIWREPREVLIKWALTSENHHRLTKNIKLLGGLEDYVNTMTNEQLIDYIMTKAKEYPELNSAQTLDSLAIKYGIN